MTQVTEFGAALVLVALGHSAIWPWTACLACKGRRGRGPGSTAAAWNRCPVCGGSGERLRLLAHLTRRDLARKLRKR